MNKNDIAKLDTFSHGFFQDILTMMKVLDIESLTKNEINGIIGYKIKQEKRIQEKINQQKENTLNRKKKLMKKMGWELKENRKPCNGC